MSQSSPKILPVVENGFCCGCGVCASVCPKRKLEMRCSDFGEFNPSENRGTACANNCNLCITACPFGVNSACEDVLANALFKNEPAVEYQQPIGYFTSLHAGHVNNESKRLSSPSGGIATWFLEQILKQGIVNKIICVAPTSDPNKLFSFVTISSIDELRQAACSSYYPVEASMELKELLENEGQYAITCLPCLAKGVRRAMSIYPKLRDRVKIVAGIACGTMQSALYASFLCGMNGHSIGEVSKVNFRQKHQAVSSRGYSFTYTLKDGASEHHIFPNKLGGNSPWSFGFFQVRSCRYCDDLFNELADVTFLDAWSPRYIKDYKGDNYIITRTALTKGIIETGVGTEELQLFPATSDEVVASQKPALFAKRVMLPLKMERVAKRVKLGSVPQKRFQSGSTGGFLVKIVDSLQMCLAEKGRVIYAANPTPAGVEQVWRKTKLLRFCYRIVKKVALKLT